MDISDKVVEAFGNKIVPSRKPVSAIQLTPDNSWIALFEDGSQSFLGNYGKPTPGDVNAIAISLNVTILH